MQGETFVELATIVSTAACKACYGAPEFSDAGKLSGAPRTTEQERPGAGLPRERQRVTAVLVRDAEVAARLPPLRAMRRDPAASPARVSNKMGELVPQGAIDLGGPMCLQ